MKKITKDNHNNTFFFEKLNSPRMIFLFASFCQVSLLFPLPFFLFLSQIWGPMKKRIYYQYSSFWDACWFKLLHQCMDRILGNRIYSQIKRFICSTHCTLVIFYCAKLHFQRYIGNILFFFISRLDAILSSYSYCKTSRFIEIL